MGVLVLNSFRTLIGPTIYCQGLSPGDGGSCLTISAGCYAISPTYNYVSETTCTQTAAAEATPSASETTILQPEITSTSEIYYFSSEVTESSSSASYDAASSQPTDVPQVSTTTDTFQIPTVTEPPQDLTVTDPSQNPTTTGYFQNPGVTDPPQDPTTTIDSFQEPSATDFSEAPPVTYSFQNPTTAEFPQDLTTELSSTKTPDPSQTSIPSSSHIVGSFQTLDPYSAPTTVPVPFTDLGPEPSSSPAPTFTQSPDSISSAPALLQFPSSFLPYLRVQLPMRSLKLVPQQVRRLLWPVILQTQ